MAKKHLLQIIDKESIQQNKIIKTICKECGKEALCGTFCLDCRNEMRKTFFLKPKY